MTRLAHFLMASEWRAALIASGLLFLPLLSWAGASVVALYALRRGLEKSRLVTLIPLLVASVMAFGFGDYSCLGSRPSPHTELAFSPDGGTWYLASFGVFSRRAL